MARTRAFRRYQYEFRKTRVLRRYRNSCVYEIFDREDPTQFWLGFHANTPHPCSGRCCGNQRKWTGEVTLQEKRSDYWLEDEW